MATPAQKLAVLDPQKRAQFATASRLLSCLVTESLSRALYFPLAGFEANGVAIVLNADISSRPPSLEIPVTAGDILAAVPLIHIPIFKHDAKDPRGIEIGLLDPLDMAPLVFIPSNNSVATDEHRALGEAIHGLLNKSPGWDLSESFAFTPSFDPIPIWDSFSRNTELEERLTSEVREEYISAVKWQTYSYQQPPPAPQFSSSSVEWEQSIVEGHPTHPMHKTRIFLPPIPQFSPGQYDLYHPKLRFIQLPRTSLHITYDYEKLVLPLLRATSEKAGEELKVKEGYVVVPVHELQIAHIKDKFDEAELFEENFYLDLLAQQSIRSVVVPSAYTPLSLSLKLGVGIKLTSAIRTISPASAFLGPRFSSLIVPHLSIPHSILTVACELASVVHTHPDGDVAKHCSVIIREAHEVNSVEEKKEKLIVCTALVESGHAGQGGEIPAVIRVFGLDTVEKRVEWLDNFVRIFFAAFLPTVINNGVAFECHPQNCLARFSIPSSASDKPQLLGFIIRDFGGLRIHLPTLYSSSSTLPRDLEPDAFVDPAHSILAPTLEDVYTRMYHTVFHNHLQQLVRVLGLHYCGRGWAVVRRRLDEAIPVGHGLRAAWMGEDKKTVDGKCFLRMRMSGMYRFHLHGPFPNLIHYRGVQGQDVLSEEAAERTVDTTEAG